MKQTLIAYTAFLILALSLVACQNTSANNPPMPQFNELLVGTDSGIVKIDANSGTVTPLGVGGQWFDLHDGKIYSAKKDWTTVEVFDLSGNTIKTITHPYFHAVGIVVVGDNLIALLDNDANKVQFIDMSGSLVHWVSFAGDPSSAQNMDGVVVGNRLVVSEDGKKRVFYVDLDDYSSGTIADLSGISATWLSGIAYYAGTYYTGADDSHVYKFAEGGEPTLLATIIDAPVSGMELGNGYLYATVFHTGKVYKIDLADGAVTLLASGLSRPENIRAIP